MADIALLAGLNRPRPVTAFFDSLVAGINSGVNLNMQVRQEKRAQGQETRAVAQEGRAVESHKMEMDTGKINQDRAKFLAEQEKKLAPLEQRAKELDQLTAELNQKQAQFTFDQTTSDQARKIKQALFDVESERAENEYQRRLLKLQYIEAAEEIGAWEREKAGALDTSGAPTTTTETDQFLNRWGESPQQGVASAAPVAGASRAILSAVGMKSPKTAGAEGYTQPQYTNLEQDVGTSVTDLFSEIEPDTGPLSPKFKAAVQQRMFRVIGEAGPASNIGARELFHQAAGIQQAAEAEQAIYSGVGGLTYLLGPDIKAAGTDPTMLGTTEMFSGDDLEEAAKASGLGSIAPRFKERDKWAMDDIMKIIYGTGAVPWTNPLTNDNQRNHPVIKFFKEYEKQSTEAEVAGIAGGDKKSPYTSLQSVLGNVSAGAGKVPGLNMTPVPGMIGLAGRAAGGAGALGGVSKVALFAPNMVNKGISAVQQVALSKLMGSPDYSGKIPPVATNQYLYKAVSSVAGEQAAQRIPVLDRSMTPDEISKRLVADGVISENQRKALASELGRMVQELADSTKWVNR